MPDPSLDEPLVPDLKPGSFLGNVNVVMLTYAADGVLAFATGVLVARALGPEGRGAYGLFVVAAALGQMVLGLGAGNAAIYYLNRRSLPLRAVVSAMHVVALWSLAAGAIFIVAVAPWAGDDLFGGRVSPWLFVAAVPLLLYVNLLRLVLQAMSRFLELGTVVVAQQAIVLALVSIASITGDPSPTDVVGYWLIASALTAAFALWRIGVENIDPAQVVRPRWDVLRDLTRFGVQGEAGNVLQALNYRLDQYIVRAFVGLAGVGIYGVGVSMTEGVWLIANAVALVLVPRMSADPDEARWMAPLACRNTMFVAAAASIALAIVAPIVIPLAFGDDFRESVQALWWLLPGTVALAGSKVLTSYIFSSGQPLVNTLITVVSLVVTLAAGFALIPPFGVNGAAAAASLAYMVHMLAALYAYQRVSGERALAAVLPRFSDVQLYTDAIRGVLSRRRSDLIGARAATRRG